VTVSVPQVRRMLLLVCFVVLWLQESGPRVLTGTTYISHSQTPSPRHAPPPRHLLKLTFKKSKILFLTAAQFGTSAATVQAKETNSDEVAERTKFLTRIKAALTMSQFQNSGHLLRHGITIFLHRVQITIKKLFGYFFLN
jgi:hypothetical protein